MLAAAFYMFIKALEYESVNLKPDPREVVGKRFDPDTGKEIYVTRAGAEVNIAEDNIDARALAEQGIAAQKAERLSGNTAVRNEETYSRGPDLEAGDPLSPPAMPMTHPAPGPAGRMT